jgi:hypothetical protein
MTVTNQNLIEEEIKRRLNSGNAFCHSVQNLRIYKTIILPVALYGCVTWTLTLREEHRLRGPPLWSSGQRSGFDSWRYQIFIKVVGLEQGPLSLVRTVEKLLERRSRGSDLENLDYGRRRSATQTT